jgi:hypothetical protein
MKIMPTPPPKTRGKAGQTPIDRIFRKVVGREMTMEERHCLSLNGNGNGRNPHSRNGASTLYKRAAR